MGSLGQPGAASQVSLEKVLPLSSGCGERDVEHSLRAGYGAQWAVSKSLGVWGFYPVLLCSLGQSL